MVVNSKNNSRVKFISYTGKYPTLCSGVLTLEIDGVEYKFGHNFLNHRWDEKLDTWIYTDEDPEHPNFEQFWTSGGNVTYDDNWNWDIEKGEWEINVELLPEKFWDVADEIDKVMNKNMRKGCCGGCI